MARLKELNKDDFNEEQAAAYEEIVKRFPRLGGPYLAYIRVPKFLQLNKATGDYLRNNSVDPRLRLIIVLSAAHFWKAEFVWGVNVRNGLKEGFDQATIDAINDSNPGSMSDPADRLVYELTTRLLTDKAINDALYAQLIEEFGEPRLVDMVATVGFYSSVCLTTLCFETMPPADAQFEIRSTGSKAD